MPQIRSPGKRGAISEEANTDFKVLHHGNMMGYVICIEAMSNRMWASNSKIKEKKGHECAKVMRKERGSPALRGRRG